MNGPWPDRVFLKQKSKMTDYCCIFNFLRRSVDGKHLRRFQSKNAVIKFLRYSLDGALNVFLSNNESSQVEPNSNWSRSTETEIKYWMIELDKKSRSSYLCLSPALQCIPKKVALMSKQSTLIPVKKKGNKREENCHSKICPILVRIFVVEIWMKLKGYAIFLNKIALN